MAASIAFRAKSASRWVRRSALIGQDWRLAIEHAARRQKQTPPGAPLWHFLTKPASIAYTDDGELALELGDPPLVLISSDSGLLPELYLELEAMRYGSQLRRMTDTQRQHQARIYTAGAYLADALEQLAEGLLVPAATRSSDPWQCARSRGRPWIHKRTGLDPHLPVDVDGQVPIDTCPSTSRVQVAAASSESPRADS